MEFLKQIDNLLCARGTIVAAAAHLDDNEIQQAVYSFFIKNQQLLAGLEPDVTRLNEPKLISREFEIDMRLLLATLDATKASEFWTIFRVLGGPEVAAMWHNNRRELGDALGQFGQALNQVGCHLNDEQIISLVKHGRTLIENRKMPEGIAIPQGSTEVFWQHMENCYNQMFPSNPVKHHVRDASDKFVDKILNVVGGVANNGGEISIDGMLQQITGDSDFMQEMEQMFGGGQLDPSMLGSMMTNMVSKFTGAMQNMQNM